MLSPGLAPTPTLLEDTIDPTLDPGWETARERADAAASRGAPALAGSNIVRVGTASWTDPTITAEGVFYPPNASTPEKRLRYYAQHFSVVEVDSTYYALPARRNAELWAQRTPSHFVFDVKAYALMTGHPTEISRMPKVLRETVPEDVVRGGRVYDRDLPGELRDAVWRTFVDALEPLHVAGKMGAVLLQYPPWFHPSGAHREWIVEAAERLRPLRCAVEFRDRRWFTDGGERTLDFLAREGLTYVMVDEPQGLASSVPPVVAVTDPTLAIIRMHGRRGARWEKFTGSAAERYRYLYDREELEEWLPRVEEVRSEAQETHMLFNNCWANYGTTNALEMSALLAQLGE